MSYLFISHSSNNDFESLALQNWLKQQGWDDVFIDIDPQRGILAGQRWERALHEAANKCDAVLCCVSQEWIDSPWCRKEFRLAHRLNKKLIGLLIEDIPVEALPSELTDTWQFVNLASGNDHEVIRVTHPNSGKERHIHFSMSGLTRLKAGLIQAGLSPLFYEWPPENDPQRLPYRGMAPLESIDAGIFFGRVAPTNELLSKLVEMNSKPCPGLMVILGASGAGKSSFLRAGVLPRLTRDDKHFITLPIIRPEQSVLWGENGLLNSLTQASADLKLKNSRAVIRKLIESACSNSKRELDLSTHAENMHPAILELIELLSTYTKQSAIFELDDEVNHHQPTIVLPVDQGEELFNSEGVDESEQFLDLLGLLTTQTKIPVLVLFTIRSDSFERLQTYKAFEGVTQQTFSLAPMPQGAYQSVIEGPAARLKDTKREIKIDPALTQQLSIDIEKGGNRDALPLLAFTMERLYVEYASSGTLTLQDYHDMGGIEGAIEAAVELAIKDAIRDPALPNTRESVVAILHRGLIPWLAGIDPHTQTPRRRVAILREIPEESRPIIEHLISQRLLLTDVDKQTQEITIEPAHEALLRQWGLLKGWLKEDFASLTIIESIQSASRDWHANGKHKDWLSHNSGRLQDAEDIKRRDDLAQFLKPNDWEYIAECRLQEDELRNKELNEAKKLLEVQNREANAHKAVARRTTLGMAVAVALLIISAFLGYQALEGQEEAIVQKNFAESESARAQFETEKALAVNRFMQTTFESANPNLGGRKDIGLIDALKENVSKIDKNFANQPEIQAAVKYTVGLTFLALQDLDNAEPLLNDSLQLRIDNLVPTHSDIAKSYLALCDLLQEQGLYELSLEFINKALVLTEKRVGEESMELVPILDELAQSHLFMGEFALAKKVSDKSLELRLKLDGSESIIAHGYFNRAKIDAGMGDWEIAQPYASKALELKRKADDLPASIMHSLNQIANIAMGMGNLEQAEAYFLEAIAIAEQEFGKNHGETALFKENLGNIMFQNKRYDETLKLLEEVITIRRTIYGDNHDLVGRTNANMGSILLMIGKHDQADIRLKKAFSIFEVVLPPDHPNLAHVLGSMAINDNRRGLHESALGHLERARKIDIAKFGERSHQVGRTELIMARTYMNMEQISKATEWVKSAEDKLSLHPDANYKSLIEARDLIKELIQE